MSDQNEPSAPAPHVDAEPAEPEHKHPAKKPYDPHAFHPEKYRGSGIISPATGEGHNHTPGSIPLSPETHDPGE
jgi:hypothetical protein